MRHDRLQYFSVYLFSQIVGIGFVIIGVFLSFVWIVHYDKQCGTPETASPRCPSFQLLTIAIGCAPLLLVTFMFGAIYSRRLAAILRISMRRRDEEQDISTPQFSPPILSEPTKLSSGDFETHKNGGGVWHRLANLLPWLSKDLRVPRTGGMWHSTHIPSVNLLHTFLAWCHRLIRCEMLWYISCHLLLILVSDDKVLFSRLSDSKELRWGVWHHPSMQTWPLSYCGLIVWF